MRIEQASLATSYRPGVSRWPCGSDLKNGLSLRIRSNKRRTVHYLRDYCSSRTVTVWCHRRLRLVDQRSATIHRDLVTCWRCRKLLKTLVRHEDRLRVKYGLPKRQPGW